MTLRHLGDFHGAPPKLVREASAACASFARKSSPVSIALTKAMTFPGSAAFVLGGVEGNEELFSFRRALDLECRRHIANLISDSFSIPHVTVAYDRKVIAAVPIEPIAWTATELVLINSSVGETLHEILGRWPLQG